MWHEIKSEIMRVQEGEWKGREEMERGDIQSRGNEYDQCTLHACAEMS